MARVNGYGGLANTNSARDFSGKVETVPVLQTGSRRIRNRTRYFRMIFFLLGF